MLLIRKVDLNLLLWRWWRLSTREPNESAIASLSFSDVYDQRERELSGCGSEVPALNDY